MEYYFMRNEYYNITIFYEIQNFYVKYSQKKININFYKQQVTDL